MSAVIDRLLARAVPLDSPCVIWQGALQSSGYASIGIGGKTYLAHRVVWEAAHGPIPDELTVDHLCGNRRCLNAGHLELVTRSENGSRATRGATHCARGHELAGHNLIIKKRGGLPPVRNCRTCWNEYRRLIPGPAS